jgi:hypothetical protein
VAVIDWLQPLHWATFSPAFCGHPHPFSVGAQGDAFFNAFVPTGRELSEELMKRAAMLNVVKASLLGSALMLLEGCANMQSYQTPCVPGHVCECVEYTTVNRSWVDCRSYGRVPVSRPLTR